MSEVRFLDGMFERGTPVYIELGGKTYEGYYFGMSAFGSSHIVTSKKCKGKKPTGGRWRIPVSDAIITRRKEVRRGRKR